MKKIPWFGFVTALMLASVVFTGSIWALAANASEPSVLHSASLTPTTFRLAGSEQSFLVDPETRITDAGTLGLGQLARVVLSPETAYTFHEASFDPKLRILDSATGSLEVGRVYASTLLWDSRVTVRTPELTASTLGGSFVLERAEAAGLPIVRLTAVSGSVTLTLRSPEGEIGFYDTALTPGQSVTLSSDDIAGLYHTAAAYTREQAWRGFIGTPSQSTLTFAESQTTHDTKLIGQATTELLVAASNSAKLHPLLADFIKQLTLVPAARGRLLTQTAGAAISASLTAESSETDARFQAMLGEIQSFGTADLAAQLSTLVPYTRLLASSDSAEKTLAVVTQVTSLEPLLARSAHIESLSDTMALAQLATLADALAETYPTELPTLDRLVAERLTSAKNETISNAESAGKLIAAALTAHPKLAKSELLPAYHRLHTYRAQSEAGLLADLLDTGALGKQLIEARQSDAAGTTLTELATLLEQAKLEDAVRTELKAKLAGLQSRHAYLATLEPHQSWSEEAYTAWRLATEREAAAAASAAGVTQVEEISLVKVVKDLKDNRVSRPMYVKQSAIVEKPIAEVEPATEPPTEETPTDLQTAEEVVQ